ncbi:AAA family ATPase [Bacillus siamensis]|uniref:AAA family ATPase n=1 Tax=Bacillus siamensis TaxID=659243 RepID=UPI002E20FD7C|nr:AAA family ATPase [Bacillus siamensis]MED5046802.1 AAA family ATPase [Bacillus siamensis]MED5095414.1 AAA family ATPase [Bacillus siamensis]
MLYKLSCDKFREKSIYFNKGLNIVLGDSQASNSIGKSSLLMIIDFAFGGNSYIKTSADAIKNLGDHKFFFTFIFEKIKYNFSRSTASPNYIQVYNSDGVKLDKWSLKKFCLFLKHSYKLNHITSSFRDIVGIYSRVWGKNNYTVDRPLHGFSRESSKVALNKLLKLYNKYDVINENEQNLDELESTSKAIKLVSKVNLYPKINKRTFNSNVKK